MNPLLITSGEPAGIGPDVCLALSKTSLPVVIAGDKILMIERAEQLGVSVQIKDFNFNIPCDFRSGILYVWHMPLIKPTIPGKLEVSNALYVFDMLKQAVDACLAGHFRGLVTAPVNKSIINEAGIPFTGHTEFLAEQCGVGKVVMMLATDAMKVALVTTHLPIAEVSHAITMPAILQVIEQLHYSLQDNFNIRHPIIMVAGLNPHAGEGGYLGREEIDIIAPALALLKSKGIAVEGPYPADTLFSAENLKRASVFVAMYHDQGLPVLKYAGFGQAVNITLGLPIIRTSVDHGTALSLAGTGKASPASLLTAVKLALSMNHKKS